MDKEPFTDTRVRQAMVYAMLKDRILRAALAGRGTQAICLYNPDDITCVKSYARYKLDLEKARSLLTEAAKTSFTFDFSCTAPRFPATPTSPS